MDISDFMRRLCFTLSFLLFLHGYAIAAEQAWKIRPEMRLPLAPEPSAFNIKSISRFDFKNGLDGWRSRHSDVKLEHISDATKTDGVLRIRGIEPESWNFAVSPRIPVEPGKKYRAWMRLRVESMLMGSRPVYFKIELVYDDHGKSGRILSSRVPADKLKKWFRITAEFSAPKGCKQVWAAIEKGTKAPSGIDVSVDTFAVEEINEFSGERRFKGGTLIGPITKNLRGVHPRIYITAEKLRKLRLDVWNNPKWTRMRTTLFSIADQGALRGPPDYEVKTLYDMKGKKRGLKEQLWQRDVGNMIPHLAMAFLLSGKKKYLEASKQWIFKSLSYKTWGLESIDGLDLAAGHQLAGIGLAYDWLYNDLKVDERDRIRQGIMQRASAMALAASTGGVWWHDRFMNNHLWVNCTGIATAGFAVCDEIEDTYGWIRIAHRKFLTTLAMLGDDGASHEGYGYWEYGIEYMMRYMEMAYDLLGIDLYKSGNVHHPWLRNGPLYALFLSLPRSGWTRHQSIIDIGDSPRFHWYGPSYILRNLARRYPNSPWAGTAQWLAAQVESVGIDNTNKSHYLNFVFYNPTIPAVSPNKLPTFRHFKELDIVSTHSGWDDEAGMLVVKCGPPLGHKHLQVPYDYGAGHAHPDAGHFIFYSTNEFLIRDDGYADMKLTANHNSVLINGKGQKGEGHESFDLTPWLMDRRAPRIISVNSNPDIDTILCDIAPAYPPELGLKRFVRTFNFYKPHLLVVQDELEAEEPATFEWRIHLEGTVEKDTGTCYRLKKNDVVVMIRINSSASVWTAIREQETHQYIRLVTTRKLRKTQLEMTFHIQSERS